MKIGTEFTPTASNKAAHDEYTIAAREQERVQEFNDGMSALYDNWQPKQVSGKSRLMSVAAIAPAHTKK